MTKKELLNKADNYKRLIESKKIIDSDNKIALADYFKVDFIYSSNAIEGNTLSINETKTLLEDGIATEGKPAKDSYKVSGHAEAYDYMLSLAQMEKLYITEDIIKRLHYLYYNRLDHEKAGQYRKCQTNVINREHMLPSPEDLPHLMEHFINQMQSSKRLLHPIEYAALCHKRLMDISPFEESNGVVARLLLNLILINEGYGIAIITPEHQDEYDNGLKLSRRKNNPDIDPLVMLIAECIINSQFEYCKVLKIA